MLIMALDGNSLAYRAFYALPEDMANASGQVTNAVYGFTTMLLTLMRDHKPEGVVVVFDRPEPTFRHEAIPEYKAQRDKAPDILIQQLGMIRELLDVLGVVWWEKAGFEGDDLIATVAEHAERVGDDLIVVTGDRDSYQLVRDPHIRVLYNKRGVSDYALYNEAGILERTGVTPAQYADYAALRGDPSDNLAGIPGVGEKTAAKLINQYGDIEGVIAAAEAQTPKLKAGLIEHGERVKRNAAMMVLRRDVPLEVNLAELAPHPDLAGAVQMFEFLEFKTMAKRLSDVAKLLKWETRGEAAPVTAVGVIPESNEVLGQVVVADSVNNVVMSLNTLKSFVIAPHFEGEPGRTAIAGLAVVTDKVAGSVMYVPRNLLLEGDVARVLNSGVPIICHDAKPLMRALLEDSVDLRIYL